MVCIRASLACSERSDSGERSEVKKAMKSRGGLRREVREVKCGSLSHLSPSLDFIFSRSFLLRTAPHYLNAWTRLEPTALSARSLTWSPWYETPVSTANSSWNRVLIHHSFNPSRMSLYPCSHLVQETVYSKVSLSRKELPKTHVKRH